MGDRLGERIELEITGVAHGGVFVARHEGRVVFVADAIPGERVVAEITDDAKSSFWRAETVDVLDASEHRRPHVWSASALERPPADRAGGAEFGHIDLSHQRELKRRVVVDSLARFGGVERDVTVEALPAGTSAGDAPDATGPNATGPDATGPDTAGVDVTGTGWRTRLRLHVDDDGVPGQFAARSHSVVRVEDLPLAVPELQALDVTSSRFPGVEYIDLVAPSEGRPFVLEGPTRAAGGGRASRSGGPRSARGGRRGGRPGPPVASASRTSPSARLEPIVERAGGRRFALEPGGFWQVHRHAGSALSEAVTAAVDAGLFDPEAPNLDLYGGVGLFAAAVATRFPGAAITSVESDARATVHARRNLGDLPGASAETGRVDVFLRRLLAGAPGRGVSGRTRATVVLDPPRSGAGREVVDQLAEFGAAQIVYVACDPVALSRDVALLEERGYLLRSLRAFDLFPNTHHVEAVATFVRT